MPTPSIASGVVERNKPLYLGPISVWRFEGSLAAGGFISTPIFEVMRDGHPYTQLEVGTFALVPVPWPTLRISTFVETTIGFRVVLQKMNDAGTVTGSGELYFAHGGGLGYEYPAELKMTSRRCKLVFNNVPMVPFVASAFTGRFEVLSVPG